MSVKSSQKSLSFIAHPTRYSSNADYILVSLTLIPDQTSYYPFSLQPFVFFSGSLFALRL